jgi:3-isopropylmalate/(R)-2-methylmalate dehydratase small subunit
MVSMKTMEDVCMVGKKRDGDLITGKVFVVKDNIDTDQIIPAEYLTLVPSKPDEYEKLGSYAMIGLPDKLYPERFMAKDSTRTEYPIIIAGENFGCGSSREHAPIAIGACGGCAVIAQSYARIFFRNCSATGELYPWESVDRLVDHFKTGQTARIDFENQSVTNVETGETFDLRPLGDVLPVIDAGGIFEFARKSGMIGSKGSQN